MRTAAETFPPNPKIDVVKMITTMGVGEALVSMLGERSVPQPVQHALIRPPQCRMGAITADERTRIRARSPVGGQYDVPIDRESAHEVLAKRAQETALAAANEAQAKSAAKEAAARQKEVERARPRASSRQTTSDAILKSTVRTFGSTIGRELARGLLGSLIGRRK